VEHILVANPLMIIDRMISIDGTFFRLWSRFNRNFTMKSVAGRLADNRILGHYLCRPAFASEVIESREIV
jgi:hypothetical protein